MGNINRTSALILIGLIAISCLSLLSVKPANAQTIPKPSVPEFTVNNVVYTVYTAPTYTTNPYTGQNETANTGGTSTTQAIVFMIKNQPFTPYTDSSGNYTSLYYYIKFKGHFSNSESYYPDLSHSYGPFAGGLFPNVEASKGEVTTISVSPSTLTSYPPGTPQIPNGAQIDFQVQAIIGHIVTSENGFLAGNFYGFSGEYSDWSNTQTITINNNSNSTSSQTTTPTSASSQIPTSAPSTPLTTPVQTIIASENPTTGTQTKTGVSFGLTEIVIASSAIAIVVLSVVFYIKKHKISIT